MNEIEKAIEEFKKSKYVSKDLKVEHIELAIAALEKQVPKKPIRGRDIYNFKCIKCPTCGAYLRGWENYCIGVKELDEKGCGQKIDWSEVQ